MVSLEKAVVAHQESGGFRSEVLVDPEAINQLESLKNRARPSTERPLIQA